MKKHLLILILLISSNFVFPQIQLGQDINGEAALDASGYQVSVSGDGSRVAIGAPFNSETASLAGHVRVFEWQINSWQQIGADIDGEAAQERSGSSVALSGDGMRLAVKSANTEGTTNNIGQVRVYDYINGDWVQLGENIVQQGSGSTATWGSLAISADGTRVAIGYSYADIFNNGEVLYNAGEVKIYQLIAGNWVAIGNTINGQEEDNLGFTLAMSSNGNRIAIGGLQAGFPDSYGSARVYELIGDNWQQIGSNITGNGSQGGLGLSLSADGNRLAVGGIWDAPTDFFHGGHVKIFNYLNGNWIEHTDIEGEAENDYSGGAVSFSQDGNRLAVGAPRNSDNRGHVRIYDLIDNNWTKVMFDIDGESLDNHSGRNLSLSADGQTIAIGATGNDGNGNNSGHVRIYDLSETTSSENIFTENNKTLLFPNPSSGTFYISAINSSRIMVYDELGKLLLDRVPYEQFFDLSLYPDGLFFVKIISNGQVITQKVIKKAR